MARRERGRARVEPLVDEAVIVVKNRLKTLVVADLHLGIEEELRRKGVLIGSQTEKLLERVTKCIEATKPDAIVLLGDVKHNVPKMSLKERKEVPFFLYKLSEYAPVHIAKGNHDGHLHKLLPKEREEKISVEGAKGFLLDNIAYTHGHTIPPEELFSAEYMIIGHTHPMIRLVSSYHTSIRPVWVRAKLDYAAIEKYYKGVKRDREYLVVIMPAFNEICGGIALNHEKPLGPVASKFIKLKDAEVYLLDGSYMGKMKDIKIL
ncbi:MAG: metallophosphoesterase [Candidatus Methanospirareceae archaeon]